MTVLATLAAATLDVTRLALPLAAFALVVAIHRVAGRVGDLRDREAPLPAAAAMRRP